MKLYYSKLSSSMAVHLVLEEIGKPYEAIQMDLDSQHQFTPEFLEINPKGRVPALVLDEGEKKVVLTEVPAILSYLAQINPELSLMPTDTLEFAKAQSFNAYLSSTVHVAHAHRRRGSRWSDCTECRTSMAAKVASNMSECFAFIQAHYLKKPWVLGDTFSVCDAYLFTISRWLEGDGVDINIFPEIRRHADAMLARPPIQRIAALHC